MRKPRLRERRDVIPLFCNKNILSKHSDSQTYSLMYFWEINHTVNVAELNLGSYSFCCHFLHTISQVLETQCQILKNYGTYVIHNSFIFRVHLQSASQKSPLGQQFGTERVGQDIPLALLRRESTNPRV